MYPAMVILNRWAEKAAQLYAKKYARFVLPSGKYSISTGRFGGATNRSVNGGSPGEYQTEWGFFKGCTDEEWCAGGCCSEGRSGDIYLGKVQSFPEKLQIRAGIVGNRRKALICCKNYHARRALMYYQRAYPDTEFRVCPCCVDGITRDNWIESERGIKEVLAEVKIIVTQFSLMM